MSGREADSICSISATAILRYLDVVLVVVAAPVALALGAPALGCVIGAGAWVAAAYPRAGRQALDRNAAEPRTQLGLNLVDAFGRIWLLAGAIVAARDRRTSDGLAAAVAIFAAYSVAFAIRVRLAHPTVAARIASVRGEAVHGEALR